MSIEILSNRINDIGIDKIVLLTDGDGTMFDFHDDPEKVTAPVDLVIAFQKLEAFTGGHLYIVTGRDLKFIDRILAPFHANISAEHHCQTRYHSGEPMSLVKKPEWQKLNKAFALVTKVAEGVWVEDSKLFSRTIHTRLVNPDIKDSVETKLLDMAQRIATIYNNHVGDPVLGVKQGASALEIGPKSQDKGIALDEIMGMQEVAGRVPFFLGDSLADLPAGLRAKAHGGVFASVGDNKELKAASDVHFDAPETARKALIYLCHQQENKITSLHRAAAPN